MPQTDIPSEKHHDIPDEHRRQRYDGQLARPYHLHALTCSQNWWLDACRPPCPQPLARRAGQARRQEPSKPQPNLERAERYRECLSSSEDVDYFHVPGGPKQEVRTVYSRCGGLVLIREGLTTKTRQATSRFVTLVTFWLSSTTSCLLDLHSLNTKPKLAS